jgi:magnesium transporter
MSLGNFISKMPMQSSLKWMRKRQRTFANWSDTTTIPRAGLWLLKHSRSGNPIPSGRCCMLHRFVTEDEDFERYRGQHPYILDREGRPVGVVSLRSLLTSRRSAKLTEIMTKPVTVAASTSLDALQDLFDKYPFLGLPVVETNGRLVGVVARAAVDVAALQRAESEGLRRHGVVGDELRSMPLILRTRRRLAWLSANIVLNIIAASVISAYEENHAKPPRGLPG